MKISKKELVKVLQDLISFAWSNTCSHENTHRGGVLWEICDDCGAKWADDEGGRPESDGKPHACITNAEDFLDKLDPKNNN